MHPRLLLLLPILACGCGTPKQALVDSSDAGPDPASERPNYGENWKRDILSYDLSIDLATKRGVAVIEVAGESGTSLTLDIGNLVIESVRDRYGDLKFIDLGKQLNIGVPAGGTTRSLTIAYAFTSHDNFNGWLDDLNVTLLWPAFCGNLFPCHSDPADGARFSMNVTGAQGTAVYPNIIPADAPSYMPAIAVGDYTKRLLGTTPAGTEVNVWYRPGEETQATSGTKNLVAVFSFLEETYGDYSFGKSVGTVSVNWGSSGSLGGMEHHPYWHLASGSLSSERTNAHEAAHGWYGNGVRIACWEDFVLSEGVVTYIAARALEESGVRLWPTYECELKDICAGNGNTTALLDTCGEIDLINHDLWSAVPYQKGSYFLRQTAKLLGVTAVDRALAEFYQANVGKAARMRDLVELLKSKGQSNEIEALAVAWLETQACPSSAATLCP